MTNDPHPATYSDELVALTCDLVAFPSVAERPDQLDAVIDYAERYCGAIPGVYVTRLAWEGKPSLVATLRDTRAPAIVYNAHLDVVPARVEQYTPVVRDGRIYGRGSQDMKGSAAVLLRLLKDLAARPNPPDVGFQFVSDEEIGGMNGTAKLAEHGWGCGFFLAAEPTDLQICYQHKGAMWIDLHLTGRPAHGSRPWEGLNPLARLRDGLVAIERRFPTPDEAAWITTVVPTVVQGGDASNRLPSNVQLTLDIRHIPEERPQQILDALRDCFADAEIVVARSGPPLNTDPHDPEVQRLARCLAAVTGQAPRFYREHFATDARFYGTLGIPAVCLGPSGAGLHSDDEWVDIASLEQLYMILRRFALGEG